MSPATLSPPPVTQGSPPRTAAPPRLPQTVPLRRVRTPGGGPRLTRGAVLVSLALHAVLGVLLVMGIDEATRRADERPAGSSAERVSYVDVGQWPTSGAAATGGVVAGAGTATAAQAVTAAAIDSVIARLPELKRFPDRVPARLPPAPPGAVRGVGAPAAVPGARPGPVVPAGTGNGNAIDGDAAGGRLGPGYGDRRLVVTPQVVPEREKSEHERYMDHLNARLGAINDSVADEAAHQRRLHNWLVKDRNGREWGIGEGGVPVIAGHRIPVPLSPPIYRGRDREDAERTAGRQRAEIDRQAEDVDRDRSFRESVRNTRARVDAERRKRREAAGDSTRTTP